MTAHRPAGGFRARAEQERQLIRNVQETEWRRRMLRAGSIDADQLSNQARRILAWLAEWDDWTVDGVAELLAIAHRSGLAAARPAPGSGTRHRTGTTAPEPGAPTTDQRGSGTDHAATTEHDEPSIPFDSEDWPLEAPPAGDLAGTSKTGTRPVPAAGDEPVRARLAALRQRPESPVVGL